MQIIWSVAKFCEVLEKIWWVVTRAKFAFFVFDFRGDGTVDSNRLTHMPTRRDDGVVLLLRNKVFILLGYSI